MEIRKCAMQDVKKTSQHYGGQEKCIACKEYPYMKEDREDIVNCVEVGVVWVIYVKTVLE